MISEEKLEDFQQIWKEYQPKNKSKTGNVTNHTSHENPSLEMLITDRCVKSFENKLNKT